MARKKSIYISTAAEAVIGTVDDSLSGRINSIIIRYGAITDRDCPSLAVGEWMLICDMLNGTVLSADSRDADPVRFLWADISEAGKIDGLAEKWSVDSEALSGRVRAMPYSQQVAIIEIANRFWQGHDRRVWESDLQMLEHFGAKISA